MSKHHLANFIDHTVKIKEQSAENNDLLDWMGNSKKETGKYHPLKVGEKAYLVSGGKKTVGVVSLIDGNDVAAGDYWYRRDELKNTQWTEQEREEYYRDLEERTNRFNKEESAKFNAWKQRRALAKMFTGR